MRDDLKFMMQLGAIKPVPEFNPLSKDGREWGD